MTDSPVAENLQSEKKCEVIVGSRSRLVNRTLQAQAIHFSDTNRDKISHYNKTKNGPVHVAGLLTFITYLFPWMTSYYSGAISLVVRITLPMK